MPQTFSARAEIRTRDHCLQTLRYCSQHHEDVGDRRWTLLSFVSHYSHIHSEEKKAKLKFPDGFEPATFSFEGEAMSTKPRLLLEIQLKIFQLDMAIDHTGTYSRSIDGRSFQSSLQLQTTATEVQVPSGSYVVH